MTKPKPPCEVTCRNYPVGEHSSYCVGDTYKVIDSSLASKMICKTVKFVGCSDDQVSYGNHDDPREKLNIGQEYFVEHWNVYDWKTQVKLVGISGHFNSVCFVDAKDTNPAIDVDLIDRLKTATAFVGYLGSPLAHKDAISAIEQAITDLQVQDVQSKRDTAEILRLKLIVGGQLIQEAETLSIAAIHGWRFNEGNYTDQKRIAAYDKWLARKEER